MPASPGGVKRSRNGPFSHTAREFRRRAPASTQFLRGQARNCPGFERHGGCSPLAPLGGFPMTEKQDKLVALTFGLAVLAFAAVGYASMLGL